MTWAEWQAVLKSVAAKYDRRGHVSEASAREWFADLKELPAELVVRAIDSFYRAGEKWVPHGGEIHARALELDAIAQQRPAITVGRTAEAEAAWAPMLVAIRESLGEQSEGSVATWLEPLEPLSIDDGVLYLEAPDQKAEWVQKRFGGLLMTAAKAAEGIARVEVLPPAAEGRAA